MNAKDKLKVLIIDRVNQEDWSGAVTLLEAIIELAAPSTTTTYQKPPQEEQVPDDLKPQATAFDEERSARMARSE